MAEAGIVRLEGVGKAFRRWNAKPFLMRNLLLAPIGLAKAPEARWIFRDVSFEVRRGEAIALLGKNGAGKSTLLRMIGGTLRPTLGRVQVRGRVMPLLGVAGGMSPDMTGREFASTWAALLDLGAREAAKQLDEVAAFAGVADFLDTPLRYYSSGMVARLGVSLALHETPDLLLVDEALSVGDREFRERCAERLRSLRREGTAFVVASHDEAILRSLCDRALWLRDGALARDGDVEPTLDAYEARGSASAGAGVGAGGAGGSVTGGGGDETSPERRSG